MEEIFKNIEGYENYQISNLGNVKSVKRGIILSPNFVNKYKMVELWGNGKRKRFYMHRLVAQAFLGLDIKNIKLLVCHIDDDPSNNRVDNLFLGSHKDNSDDMKKNEDEITFEDERGLLQKK